MELKLSVLNTSDIPIYQQLYDQIAAQIIRGELVGGCCLPPIRTIASELGISVITIKRAWEELERDRFITTMVGRGCFVIELTPDELARKRDTLALQRFSKEIPLFRSLGLSKNDLVSLIDRFYIG
ncbi:MAG: GntR family transcriptional regulator [Christensenellaceae bacterium]|nr:GntR family transcriptional regulator [Christensenellaceae bacterium]